MHISNTVTTFLIIILQFVYLNAIKAQSSEAFNGPLSSWANLKSRFGAKGDGKTDDTRSLQIALDSLSDRIVSFNTGVSGYSVVYIPAGTYKITSTLVLRGKIGVKIVGEDPTKTIFLWQGPKNDTIFWANGSAYFYLGRITWDAGGRENMEAIGLHWKSVWHAKDSKSAAPVNIEFADMFFRDGFAVGIAGGTGSEGTNANDSEILITRCLFNKCTRAGVAINGYNALDYWIWYSRFIQCKVGIECNSGNYHAYNCYFKMSAKSDMMNTNCYYSSVRYSYSTGSSIFSLDNGKSSNPFKRTFQQNIIINPTNNPIQYFHAGKITLLDNYCRVPVKSNVTAFLIYDTWATTNYTVLEFGNRFENIKNLYSMPVQSYKIYRGNSIDPIDTVENTFLKNLPRTPPFEKRKIFTVPSDASAAVIQSIIDKAAALKKRAIVHFPFGIYYLEKELLLKKDCDIQLIGDGMLYASMIIRRRDPNVFENGSIFRIYCPSAVTITDLHIQTIDNKTDKSRAIVVINADQPDASLMLDQVYSGMDSTLLISGYDNLTVQKTNSFFSGGNYLVGEANQQNIKGKLKMFCYGAQFSNTHVQNKASFFAADCWWEGDKKNPPLNFTGDGTIIIQSSMVAPVGTDSNTVVMKIGSFAGKIGLIDMYLQGKIEVDANNPALQLLLWNINFYYKKTPLQFLDSKSLSYRGFFGGITSQCFNSKDPGCDNLINTQDVNLNINDAGEYINDFISQFRNAKPIFYTQKRTGITNLYFSRVAISPMFSAAIAFIKQ